jgi:hypothetical protein
VLVGKEGKEEMNVICERISQEELISGLFLVRRVDPSRDTVCLFIPEACLMIKDANLSMATAGLERELTSRFLPFSW